MRRNFLPHGNEYSGAGPFIVGVHVIMERTNAKTQDCFVELADTDIKRVVLGRYNEDLQSSFPPKIGYRHVNVEDSDQGEMMTEIFPRAKCIAWGNVQCFPVKTYNLDPYGSGFNGFLTDEELFNLVRYTQDPTRVSRAHMKSRSMLIAAEPIWHQVPSAHIRDYDHDSHDGSSFPIYLLWSPPY